MERISIFNYEAFYLDYLEGNLSEEDTRMLMEFLETHPECRLETEELFSFEEDSDSNLTFANKDALKMVDETDAITPANLEHFMIADAEGILPEEKSKELEEVIGADKNLIQTRKRYAAVYFEPDTNVIYTGKDDLKRTRRIVLWPYVSGAAAAAVIGFVAFFGFNTPDAERVTIAMVPEIPEFTFKNSWTNNGSQNQDVNNGNTSNGQGQTYVATAAGSENGSKKNKNLADIVSKGPLKSKTIPGLTSFDTKALSPVTKISTDDLAVRTAPGEQVKDDIAKNDWKNPIKPITNYISDKSKTEVEFGNRKATEEKKGGFFIKIGKFELSRNKN